MIEAAKSHKSDFNGNTREQTFSHIATAFGIDGINLPVLLLDRNARVLASNAKAAKLLSREQSEINGRPARRSHWLRSYQGAMRLRGDIPVRELPDEADRYLYDGHG